MRPDSRDNPASTEKVKLRDVAAAAGVSPATVSRVLDKNLAHLVRPELQEKVLDATRRLHYQHNHHAQILRRGKSKTIALLMQVSPVPINNQRINALEKAIWKRGYDTVLFHGGMDVESDLETLRKISHLSADGIICSGPIESEIARRLEEIDAEIPIVTLFPVPEASLDLVTVEREQGAYLAARHLLHLGHRRLGALLLARPGISDNDSGPPLSLPSQHRLQGIRRAAEEAGYPLGEDAVVCRSWKNIYAAGYEGVRDLWERSSIQPPSALVCENDQVAIGALRAFQERSIPVPEEVALVGFDNLPEGAFARVPLTTLAQPIEEEAQHAVACLFTRLERSGESPSRASRERTMISLTPSLVIRESCGAYLKEANRSG
jgi:DNA-binding LacI/PurR family transcriptional regulator